MGQEAAEHGIYEAFLWIERYILSLAVAVHCNKSLVSVALEKCQMSLERIQQISSRVAADLCG